MAGKLKIAPPEDAQKVFSGGGGRSRHARTERANPLRRDEDPRPGPRDATREHRRGGALAHQENPGHQGQDPRAPPPTAQREDRRGARGWHARRPRGPRGGRRRSTPGRRRCSASSR